MFLLVRHRLYLNQILLFSICRTNRNVPRRLAISRAARPHISVNHHGIGSNTVDMLAIRIRSHNHTMQTRLGSRIERTANHLVFASDDACGALEVPAAFGVPLNSSFTLACMASYLPSKAVRLVSLARAVAPRDDGSRQFLGVIRHGNNRVIVTRHTILFFTEA